jgi:hypothetical protein
VGEKEEKMTVTPKQKENLRPGRKGNNRKSKEELNRIITDIVSLTPNHDDFEIMNMLGIPNSTYYRYKKRIYKQSKKLWQQVCLESLEYRALQIRKYLDVSMKVYEEIALDQNQKYEAEDRMAAAAQMVQTQIQFLSFLRDGPDAIRITEEA